MAPTSVSPAPISVLPDPLVLRLMTVDDKDELAALFCETFKREPLGEYNGVRPEEGESVALASVQDPVSFVVEDTSLEGPHRLIAFGNGCILTAQKIAEKQKKTLEEGPEDSVEAILGQMLDLWVAKTTVFKSNPEARVMKFMTLGVRSQYEGRGLAKSLVDSVMNKARESNCDAVMVVASAFATQYVFRDRLGFEEIAKVRYTDFTYTDKRKGSVVEERPFSDLVQPEFLMVLEKRLTAAVL